MICIASVLFLRFYSIVFLLSILFTDLAWFNSGYCLG